MTIRMNLYDINNIRSPMATINIPQTSAGGQDLGSGREYWRHAAALEQTCSQYSHCFVSVIADRLSVPLLLSAAIKKRRVERKSQNIQPTFICLSAHVLGIYTILIDWVPEHLRVSLIKTAKSNNKKSFVPSHPFNEQTVRGSPKSWLLQYQLLQRNLRCGFKIIQIKWCKGLCQYIHCRTSSYIKLILSLRHHFNLCTCLDIQVEIHIELRMSQSLIFPNLWAYFHCLLTHNPNTVYNISMFI